LLFVEIEEIRSRQGLPRKKSESDEKKRRF
jgi:hypothetical protein